MKPSEKELAKGIVAAWLMCFMPWFVLPFFGVGGALLTILFFGYFLDRYTTRADDLDFHERYPD